MESETEQLPIFTEEPNQPESFPKIVLIAGGAIVGVFLICIVLTSLMKNPSISKIEMPSDSALKKQSEEVAGANTQNAEVLGPQKEPTTSPTEKQSPTESPTTAPTNTSPTNTPTPTSKPADPTNTPQPTATPTQTPTPTEEPTATPTPNP